MTAQRPLADRLALPILLLGAVSISFSGIFVKLSETGPSQIPAQTHPKGAPPPKPVAPLT